MGVRRRWMMMKMRERTCMVTLDLIGMTGMSRGLRHKHYIARIHYIDSPLPSALPRIILMYHRDLKRNIS